MSQLVLPTHLGDREERPQDVQTPLWLYREAVRRWGRGGFHIDLAAGASNTLCPFYFSMEHCGIFYRGNPQEALMSPVNRVDFLIDQRVLPFPPVSAAPPWRGWNNPPFEDILPWCKLCHDLVNGGGYEVIVQLLPGRPGTDWWQYAKRHGAEIHEIRGRVPFVYPDGATKGGNFEWNVFLVWSLPIAVADFVR